MACSEQEAGAEILQFCSYYRKFVRDFSFIAKPLFVLTENQIFLD